MIIWHGWGILAVIYGVLAMVLGMWIDEQFPDASQALHPVSLALLVAAAATWFTGKALNKTSPQRKLDEWSSTRRLELNNLVQSGQFSLGPDQPQPRSIGEAQEMADALFEYELSEMKQIFNRHTLFYIIPMQYAAFVWAGLAILFAVLSIAAQVS